MTTEEKYNKALELARTYYNGGNEFLDTIFPELTESEDERIRKGLVQHLKELRNWKVGTMAPIKVAAHYDAWIAYLEKQKEPLTPEEKMNHPLYLEGFDVGREVGAVVAKPAEWSEDDEEIREEVIGDLCALKDWIVKYDVNWLANPVLKSIDKRISWLKALHSDSYKNCNSRWKPSEQEKGALRTAICVLTEERNFPKTAGHLQAILDAFEGKESHKGWKPSDEQMRYLLAVINDPNNIGAESCYMTIKSLYNDLNKL